MPIDHQQHFASVLASTVHDIKNSLGIQQQLIQKIALILDESNNPDITQLKFESNRMNHSMMQLLILYKIESHKFNLEIDEYPALDILEEVQAQHASLFQSNGINLLTECPDDLMSYLDFTHISNALGTILNNAQRYSRQKVLLSATLQKAFICFAIEDDGMGYPAEFLNIDLSNIHKMDWVTGSTGLGLHFVLNIAALHTNMNQCGYIKIDNESRLGGARFRLFLPN